MHTLTQLRYWLCECELTMRVCVFCGMHVELLLGDAFALCDLSVQSFPNQIINLYNVGGINGQYGLI